jgi:hypothetical protein
VDLAAIIGLASGRMLVVTRILIGGGSAALFINAPGLVIVIRGTRL